MNETATIYLVDTDPTIRATVAEIAISLNVRSQFHDNAESFLQSYTQNRSGCIISEFRLIGMSGIALQEAMNAAGCRLPILFVTAFVETAMIVRAIKAGAITVLEKPFSRQDLWDSLQNAIVVDHQIRRVDAQHISLRRRLSRITPKERQVLEQMIAGRPNKEIAAKLSVSVRTVEARRHQIFQKTETESVAQLVKVVIESGGLKSSGHINEG